MTVSPSSTACCAPPPGRLDGPVVAHHDCVMAPSSAWPGTPSGDARDGLEERCTV
jgi:hypothetical protein